MQEEIDEMLRYYEIEEKRETMKKWYDGYLFGNTEVYNPWSAVNQIKAWAKNKDAFAIPWWANTSSNSIIETLVSKSDDNTKEILERLINGGSVQTSLKETITYGDLTPSNENIWNFLFFTGYLKATDVIEKGEETGDPAVYSLVIPNLEIVNC